LTTRILPLGSAANAIDRFHEAGGVVEYVLVDALGEPDPHLGAATAALFELEQRWDRWVGSRLAEEPSLRQSQFTSISSDPTRSIPVSLGDFVGRGYDWNTERLESTWRVNEGGSGHHKTSPPGSDFMTDGYAEAFADPPYSLRVESSQATAWFNSINADLLGGLSDALEIRSWSTDGSTWFDDGRVWWGAFLWTVRPPDRPWMVAIAASSTD
jgi:hypothetical protein